MCSCIGGMPIYHPHSPDLIILLPVPAVLILALDVWSQGHGGKEIVECTVAKVVSDCAKS